MSSFLIVGDDVVAGDHYARALALEGYDVQAVDTAEKGLEAAARTHPDALIIDLRLPHVDGAAMLEQMRSRRDLHDTPAAIVTGDYLVDHDTISRLELLGADVHFKPIDLDDLVRIAKQLLARRIHGDPERPRNGDVVIWDESESSGAAYWVRRHSRGSATPLFDGPDAWARALVAARELAGPEGSIWKRHTDGHFQKIDG